MAWDVDWRPWCPECGRRVWRGKPCQSRCCPSRASAYLRRQAKRLLGNLGVFRGDVVMLTLTAPGADVLPWDGSVCANRGPHRHRGPDGCRLVQRMDVEDGRLMGALAWDEQMWGNWSRLRKAASERARRAAKCRSGLLVTVPERQRRGVWHLHLVVGAEAAQERAWGEAFGAALQELAPAYGFGSQVDRGDRWRPAVGGGVAGYVAKLTRYIAKAQGVREQLVANRLPGRAFYVSRRLTARSGITMRSLRRRSEVWAEGRYWLSDEELRWLMAAEDELGHRLRFRPGLFHLGRAPGPLGDAGDKRLSASPAG
jgi:hypothetical protein